MLFRPIRLLNSCLSSDLPLIYYDLLFIRHLKVCAFNSIHVRSMLFLCAYSDIYVLSMQFKCLQVNIIVQNNI